MNTFRRTGIVALALMAGTATAGAQGDKCDINEGSPYQINSAKIYLGKVATGKEGEKVNHLRNAVKVLTENAERINNPLGRQWLLSRALYEWTQRPEVQGSFSAKRGDLGYTTDTDQTVDIVAALDTALTAVEEAAPGCRSRTLPFRRNVFAKLFNPAVELFNAGTTDSAAKLANRSLLIYRESPHVYTLLANVAMRRNDADAAIAAYRRAIEAAGTDTANTRVRRQAMYNTAVIMLQDAEGKSGEARTAAAQRARAYLEDYVKEQPEDANAKQALARALTMMGDTASIANIYADMLQNPSKYTDVQLFEAGSGAARAKRMVEAAQLLEAGLAQNPYYRDALFNLANIYFTAEQPEKMLPVARRLVEVDPANPDNWRLLAAVYQLQAKKTTDARLKKQQQDSLLAFLERSQKLPVRVSFSAFTHSGANHTLQGTIENLGTTAKSYDLKVEFLDKQGKVVATKTQSVGPVAPKARGEFTVSVQQPGIAAFRYAPLN